MTELLSPAGSYEAFLAAVAAGCDAVYAGGEKYSARAYANNFTNQELLDAIDYAHLNGVKFYLTLNTLCKEEEYKGLFDFINPLYMAGLDAVIVQDIGVISYIRKQFPLLAIHASTQMTITGTEGAKMLLHMGVERVVPARELSLSEIIQIRKNVAIEIECFIHGAMCYSYSGQCLFSSILGGRSGNRGRCAQPCRLPYDVYKESLPVKHPGNPSPMDKMNKNKEQYLLSMKDMCTLDLIPDLIDAGIKSFKIEGRMKRKEYTAGVTSIYRKYIDMYKANGRKGFQIDSQDRKNLLELYSRSGSETGYYHSKNGRHMITLQKPGYQMGEKEQFAEINSDISEKKGAFLISGTFTFKKGEPISAQLTHCSEDTGVKTAITLYGAVAEAAQKQPLTEETIKKQIGKTGGTSATFCNLKIVLTEDVFVPVKELNDLRRNAILKLTQEVLKEFRRESAILLHDLYTTYPAKEVNGQDASSSLPVLSVYTESRDAFLQILDYGQVKDLYLDSSMEISETMIALAHNKGKNCFLAMPYIFREAVRQEFVKNKAVWLDFFDGILVRNYEELQWLKDIDYRKEIRTDFNVYTFHTESREYLRSLGVIQDTLPLELNAYELGEQYLGRSELMVYGYLPMMISAQCLNMTCGTCNHLSDTLVLKDRYEKNMLVKCYCDSCYNIVYNSIPLSLHKEWKRIKKIGPGSIRLHFTTEEPSLVKKITEYYINAFYQDEMDKTNLFPLEDYTKGHFKRGAE